MKKLQEALDRSNRSEIPTGNVRFFDGSVVLNMGKLNNGTVTVKGKLPYIATHSLSAIYYGDANYSSAKSIGERE